MNRYHCTTYSYSILSFFFLFKQNEYVHCFGMVLNQQMIVCTSSSTSSYTIWALQSINRFKSLLHVSFNFVTYIDIDYSFCYCWWFFFFGFVSFVDVAAHWKWTTPTGLWCCINLYNYMKYGRDKYGI